jgi:hypothetical protein
MRFAATLVVLTSLVGCAQYDEARTANLAAAERERVAADDANCRSSGVEPGSPAFDDCRKRLANQHASGERGHKRMLDQMMSGSSIRPFGE